MQSEKAGMGCAKARRWNAGSQLYNYQGSQYIKKVVSI